MFIGSKSNQSWDFRTKKIEQLCKNGWFLRIEYTIVGLRENRANYHILQKLSPQSDLSSVPDHDLQLTIGYLRMVIHTSSLSAISYQKKSPKKKVLSSTYSLLFACNVECCISIINSDRSSLRHAVPR